jgi:restriction system protein
MTAEMPTWDQFMVSVLRVFSDGAVRTRRETHPLVAKDAGLSDEQLAQLLGSGQPKYKNRIGWGMSFLARTNALSRPSRGSYVITDGGRFLLQSLPHGFTEKEANAIIHSADGQKSGLVPYKPSARGSKDAAQAAMPAETEPELDPIEQVQTGIERIHTDVADELLIRLHQNDPAFFEQTVVDLVVAMGYAGADGVAARTQLTNDGGIDGVIDQDALGLNRVYIQAKRYSLDSTVSRPDIQAFVGALHGVQADRGLFITTAKFSSGAKAYADSVNTRVILVDGTRLADLMIRFGVGVQVQQTINIVKLDEDYFE